MIRVEHLSKSYDHWSGPRALALNDLSFHVPAGHIVGLVGKNGAGKSTALKILSGQLLPSGGEVWVEGFPASTQPLEVRRRIGFLPETPPLYPEMTVAGYLAFAARLRGVPGRLAQVRVGEAMERLGLEEVAGERLQALSRGFQQRVGIAQAIVHGPPVVLLDEPMAGLDPLQIVQARELVRGLRPQHTVLFSSHILGEIASLCDSILLLDQGRLRAQGTEAELRRAVQPALLLTVRARPERVRAVLQGIAGLALEWLPASGPAAMAGAAGEEPVLHVRLRHAQDVREPVSRACVQAGLGLLELRPEGASLEALFVQLLGPQAAQGGSEPHPAAPGVAEAAGSTREAPPGAR